MTDVQTEYISGFKDALIRIVRRQDPNVSEELEPTLTRLIDDWKKVEEKGGLCISGGYTDKQIKLLDASGIAYIFHAENLSADNLRVYEVIKDFKPFVIDQESEGIVRIYPHRTFFQEALLARKLSELASKSNDEAKDIIKRLPKGKFTLNAEQESAITKALEKNLSIISGGPGTGKTTTVIYVLEAILTKMEETAAGNGGKGHKPLVYLAAPTGKAKKRLWSSVEREIVNFPRCKECNEEGRLIANTIHKWLSTTTSTNERPSANNPLDCDVLVVDEASMIGSNLACLLFDVIDTEKTKVILVGDKDQLQAVEPGNVYADISDPEGALGENVTILKENHRSKDRPAIVRLAKEINEAEDSEKWFADFQNVVQDEKKKEVDKQSIDCVTCSSVKDKNVQTWLCNTIGDYLKVVSEHLYKENVEPADLEAVWKKFSKFRFIAAANHGSGSVEEINKFCEEKLKEQYEKYLKENQKKDKNINFVGSDGEGNYPGKLIIVTKNDYSVGVVNGDEGIIYRSQNGDAWEVYFGDSTEELGDGIDLTLLPNYETAYAITIHKAQGSEFEEVGVFLPDIREETDERENLETKELLYTAITRAQKKCTIFGREADLKRCIENKVDRSRGLADRLWQFKPNTQGK